MFKRWHRWVLLGATVVGTWWGLGVTPAQAAAKIVKLSTPAMAKPVRLKVTYLFGTELQDWNDGIHTGTRLTGLTSKMKIGRHPKRTFFVYRQATVKRHGKRLIYYYVSDKDRVIGGWVHHSHVKSAKFAGYTQEIKQVYNIIRQNATTWSFNRAKEILGDTNPAYPYDAKLYDHDPSSGRVLWMVGTSHIGDVVPQLVHGMTKSHTHNLAEPPFDAQSALKDGHTLWLLYRYYQKRGPAFSDYYGDEFPAMIRDIHQLNTAVDEGGTNAVVYSLAATLETHIDQLDDDYN